MDWEALLVTLYLQICKEYRKKIWVCCQRFTNGGYQQFTDEEVMTIYIFGLLNGQENIKTTHRFAKRFFKPVVSRAP